MRKNAMSLSVVIVTQNSQHEIAACLRSLVSSLSHCRWEIIVVDNNSQDRTCMIVKRQFPVVRLLKQKRNVGFGQGNNIGLATIRYDTVLLLNPDTIVNKEAIQTLWTFLRTHPEVGAVGPEQINGEGRSIFTTSKLSARGIVRHSIEYVYSLFTHKPTILFPHPYRTSMINAGCIMARAHLFPTRVWFDPNLFLYGEEVDLCHRIDQRGWHMYFLRNCTIIHFRERSIQQTNKKVLFAFKSFSYVLMKLFTGKTTRPISVLQ